MKNAPTIGTIRNDCGAGPCRRLSACMLAIAVAVAPMAKPQNAADMIAHIVVDMKGFTKIELTFSTGSSATSCNALIAKY